MNIWNFYLEMAGSRTADEIVRNVIAVTEPFADFPHIGRSRDEIKFGLRSIISVPFIVFYQLDEHELRVVRVVDGRRDIEEVLTEDHDDHVS